MRVDLIRCKHQGRGGAVLLQLRQPVGIVPKHIWSTGEAASKPATWANPKPVGTGAFTVESCTSNNISYVANGNYWQPGKPYVEKVQYRRTWTTTRPTSTWPAARRSGVVSTSRTSTTSTRRSPRRTTTGSRRPRTWRSCRTTIRRRRPATWRSGRRSPTRSTEQISKIGESGYQPAANQTGVVTPTFDKYFDKDALTAAGYDKPNPDKAKQLLESAGYSSSNPLKLSVITVTGYTDWDASLAVVKQQLAAVGIELTI